MVKVNGAAASCIGAMWLAVDWWPQSHDCGSVNVSAFPCPEVLIDYLINDKIRHWTALSSGQHYAVISIRQ